MTYTIMLQTPTERIPQIHCRNLKQVREFFSTFGPDEQWCLSWNPRHILKRCVVNANASATPEGCLSIAHMRLGDGVCWLYVTTGKITICQDIY